MTDGEPPRFSGVLTDVRFQQVTAELVATDTPLPWRVDYSIEPGWDADPPLMLFLVELHVRAFSNAVDPDDVQPDDAAFTIDLGLLLTYELPPSSDGDPADVASAGMLTALHDGWPYLRRVAQSLGNELGVPDLTAPGQPVLPLRPQFDR